jgi:hypothetical protein
MILSSAEMQTFSLLYLLVKDPVNKAQAVTTICFRFHDLARFNEGILSLLGYSIRLQFPESTLCAFKT